MSKPLGFSTLLDLDGKVYSLDASGVNEVKSISSVAGPKVLVTDFKGAASGVESINAKGSYAKAIVEKKLRDNGDVEGASEILVMNSYRAASASKLFFSAVSIDVFDDYAKTISSQNDHCLVIPIWSVMFRAAKKNSVVALRLNDRIEVLVVKDNKPVSSFRVSSSGAEDWDRGLAYLANEITQLESDLEFEIKQIQWFEFVTSSESIDLTANLASLTDKKIVTSENSINKLLKGVQSRDAIKTFSATYLYMFEASLPWVAGLVLATSVALYAVSVGWQNQSNDYLQATQQKTLEMDYAARIASIQTEVNQSQKTQEKVIDKQARFIDEIHELASQKSIPKMIADLKQAASKELSINSVEYYFDKKSKQGGLKVIGFTNKNLEITKSLINTLNANLMNAGYEIQQSRFLRTKSKNGFEIDFLASKAL